MDPLVGVAVLAAVCITLFLLSRLDCDMTLLWNLSFGKSPDILKGQVAWVTGCSSGIGEALVYRLAESGCKLVLSARREAVLNKVKQNCIDISGGKLKSADVLVLPLDLLQYDTHTSAAETVVKYFKKIDILVNNAGRSQRSLIKDTPIEVDKQLFDVDLLAPISVTKATLPHMVAGGGGQIMVTSSVAGKLGAPGSATYSGAKHALQGFFEALRIEYAPDKIRVTMACPGPVFSDALLHAFTEVPNQELNIEMDTKIWKRMTAARCAHLMAVAMANRLDEVWLTPQPELFYCYMFQYSPYIARKVSVRLGQKRAQKVKDGNHDLH